MAADDSWKRYTVDKVDTVTRGSADALFICCASFERRAVGAVGRLASGYRCRRAVVFLYDSPDYREDRLDVLRELRESLERVSLEGVEVIGCDKENVFDGLGQFATVLHDVVRSTADGGVTLDISTFTKLYLLEVLWTLVERFRCLNIQALCTLPKAYGRGRISEGVTEFAVVPHLGGFLPIDGNVVLFSFLAFEGERNLAVAEAYDPRLTVALISEPEYRKGYRRRAEEGNSFLLSRPGVVREGIPPHDLGAILQRLESLNATHVEDEKAGRPSLVLVPLGTHTQALATFLFWKKHRMTHVVYAFPRAYGKGFRARRSGATLRFDLQPYLRE